MENRELNGISLLMAFNHGAERVINQRQEINRINVFPVADSDTGNNLASLMRSIASIHITNDMSIETALELVAQKAIEGAKGNSGMIFAQYLYGLSNSYKHLAKDLNSLIDSLCDAVNQAVIAVKNPQEGTILTVMREWSMTLKESYSINTFEDALSLAQQKALSSLETTRKNHKVLKKYGVIDAGAKGFYEFIAGITDYLLNKETPIINLETTPIEIEHEHHEESKYRYCMEVNVQLNSKKEGINLEDLGDSIVEVKTDNYTRIHLHTDQPQKVVEELSRVGTVHYIKADDMHQQVYDNYHQHSKIALVSDSIADLSKETIQKYNIHIMPLTIMVEQTEHLDKITIDNDTLLHLVDNNIEVTSSQINQAFFLRQLENLEKSYEKVIVISVSSGLSGSYEAMSKALGQYTGPLEVVVIDSLLNSLGQGLLVKKAHEYIESNMDFKSIIEKLRKDRERIKIYVAVSDLNPMVRSGRISKTLGKIAINLRLKPIVSLDKEGKGTLIHLGFSKGKNSKTILNKAIRNRSMIEDISIGYTSNNQEIKQWKNILNKSQIQCGEPIMTSAIVALGAGHNANALALMWKEE